MVRFDRFDSIRFDRSDPIGQAFPHFAAFLFKATFLLILNLLPNENIEEVQVFPITFYTEKRAKKNSRPSTKTNANTVYDCSLPAE